MFPVPPSLHRIRLSMKTVPHGRHMPSPPSARNFLNGAQGGRYRVALVVNVLQDEDVNGEGALPHCYEILTD